MALDTGLIGKTWPIMTYDICKEKICDHHPRRGNREGCADIILKVTRQNGDEIERNVAAVAEI